MFNKIFQECIKNVYDNDLVNQKNYMNLLCNKVRRMNYEVCLQAKAFFIPNNEYLMHFTFPDVVNEVYNVYDYSGQCIWQNYLVFPIFDVGNTIVGLAGFNPLNYLKARETLDWSLNYYLYSNKSVMQKGRYVYTLPGGFQKALHDGYLIVVDGLFDAIHLSSEGFNAASLMGSTVTDEIVAMLRFIKKVIVIADNDDAGLRLIKDLKACLHNVVYIYQGRTKDVDDLLKTDSKNKFLELLNRCIADPVFMDYYLEITTRI